jgi:DNA-binding SARP family transcriptional activator
MLDFKVVTFGQARVLLGDQDIVWHASSARDLFFFLLSFPEGRSKEDVASMLWPQEEDDTAASSNRFRVALHRVRATLGTPEAVVKEHDRYHLSPEVLRGSDVYALHTALHDAECAREPAERLAALMRAVNAYGGEYLPDHRADWAVTARAEHKASYVRATLELSMLHCEAAECELAIRHLAQALRADPLIGENYHQDLMACLASVESKYAAVEHYRRFLAYLRDDLADTPMLETTVLAERLKAGELICPHQIGAHAPCARHLAALNLAEISASGLADAPELLTFDPDPAGVHAELERAQVVLRLANLLQPAGTLEEVARLTLQALGTALDLESLFIVLVDDGVLRVTHVWGEVSPDLHPHLESGQVPLSAAPLCLQAIGTRQTQYTEAQHLDAQDTETHFPAGPDAGKTTVAVPIIGKLGEVQAVMSLSREARADGWTAHEHLLLEQAGRTLGLTLGRDELHGAGLGPPSPEASSSAVKTAPLR